MNSNIRKIFYKITFTISANFIVLITSVLMAFFVPKLIGIVDYSYWQLYIFYVSYTGFFQLGWADGVYLRHGGKYYSDLDFNLMNSQYWAQTFVDLIIVIGFYFFSVSYFSNSEKSFILMLTGLNCLLLHPRSILQYILQSTGRVKEYAHNVIAEKFLMIFIVFLFLLSGYREYRYLLLSDVMAKCFAGCRIAWICRDIVFTKRVKFFTMINESWNNISTGIRLMFANIASMLTIGIVRFGIERSWDVTTFGKVSFTLSISNLIITFIAAVSVVIFPIIKRSEAEKLPTVYDTLGSLLSGGMLIFLVAYYPIQKILLLWLPYYYEAIQYFAILFPISMFEARTSLLINTYLKALREEKAMLFINGFSVLLSLVTTVIVTVLFKNLTAAIMSIVGLQIVKCLIPDFYLQRKMNMKVSFEVLWDALGAIVFIIGNWFIGGLQGWGLYIVFIVFIGIIRRKEFLQHFARVKKFVTAQV